MADRARCDLPYGHFGRGIYSADDHSWHFDRNLSFASTTQLLGEPRILSNPSPALLDHGTHREGPPSKRYQTQIKNIADYSPHLQPALGILAPLLRVSEAAQDAVYCHDPLKGSLISSGEIHSYSRNRSIPVTAYVTGETGCNLNIIQVQKQKQGWDDDRHSWLEVPAIHGEQATWSSNGGPIQQAHFASSIQPGPALLAVRLRTRTSIIRTVQVKTPSEDSQGTSISPNVLYSVDMKQTGGRTHVDVAFNPWFLQQVALVDVAGNWTVLEFSTRNMDKVARSWSNIGRKPSVEKSSSINDGWARISWVFNLGTLAVCRRESLKLVSIADDDPVVIEKVELGLSGAVPWILDFLVLPGRSNYFSVLTSTHILVYQVVETTTSKTHASVKFRIRHFKNPEDLSLRLTAWTEDDDEGVGVLVYSNRPVKTSIYRFKLSEAYCSVTADSIDLQLLMGSAVGNRVNKIAGIQLQRVEMAQRPTTKASRLPFKSTHFFSALIMSEDLGACQALLCIGHDTTIPPLAWVMKLPSSSFKVSRRNFVAEDSPLDLDRSVRQRVEPSARRSRQAGRQDSSYGRNINVEQVTNILQSPVEDAESFADVLSSIESELRRSDLDASNPMRTLYSFAQAALNIGDIEECSAALGQLSDVQSGQAVATSGPLLEADEHGQHWTLASLAIPPFLGLGDLSLHTDLASVYDRILTLWITSLPESIPGRVRLARAKLCGLVAAQLVLASQSLRIEELPDSQPSHELTQPDTQSQDPYGQRSQQPGDYRRFALSQLDSSQAFQSSALPTPSQTPSITTASSRPSTFAAPELNRLSKYISFDKPAPPALPRSLNNVLSHWKVGEDINKYDWMSTSRSIAQHDEEADDEMTETERRRARRRAERHMRRQRKEAAASQAQQLASSQAPEIFSASQPMGLRIESQPSGMPASSQMAGFGTGAAAASQVEAGRFGGRPAVAAGKKRRRQGF